MEIKAEIIQIILQIIGLLGILAIIVGFPGMFIALIMESNKHKLVGQKQSYKFTKIFGISFGVGTILFVIVLVLWGIASYMMSAGLGAGL